MSREVRRVPVGWKHPVEHNPYWLEQSLTPYGLSRPPSRMREMHERFVGLCDDFPGTLARWEEDLRAIKAREGSSWAFRLKYHLTGYQGRDDKAPVVHPKYVFNDAGEEESIEVRDEDHLHELLVVQVEGERPDAADYMPVFDAPESELGWCLYETVSEGTPTTPVFATAEELIEHLATVGQDHDQKPMRRTAAEALVSAGFSAGSFMSVGGQFYESDMDADKLDALPKADL